MRIYLKLAVLALVMASALASGPTSGRGVDIGRIAPSELERQCNAAMGVFVTGKERTYHCEFPNGMTVSCDRRRFCVRYATSPTGVGSGRPNDAGILRSP